MKTSLLLCFLLFSLLVLGQRDREIIKEIDDLNTSALLHFNNNRIAESFSEFNKAKVLSDSIEDLYGNAVANFNLGNIYSLMQQQESAEVCYFDMLKASKKIKDRHLSIKAYLNLGLLYKNKRIFNKATKFFENALKYAASSSKEIYNENSPETETILFDVKTNLAEVYLQTGEDEKALVTLLRAKTDLTSYNVDTYSEAYYNYVYGLYFSEKDHYSNADLKFRETIALLQELEEDKSLMLLSNVYKKLSDIYSEDGNDEEAYNSILMYNYFRDKFINEEKIKQDIIAKSKFQIADYKFNADFADYKRLKQIEMTNKIKRINIVITITLFLLFISLITLFISYRSKRKLSNILKIRNKELQLATVRALKSSELKSKFISNVSHELRTPLYGVVGITSLLLNEKKNFSARETKYLKSLKYSGDYLLSLVNDILQVNKMEAQKIELKNVSVNIDSLAQHIVDSFEYRLQESNNKIVVSIDEGIPANIKCDKVRLSQVLINLIGNSIKFTDSGVINLRIKLLKRLEGQVGLRFEVEDNGKGIPKDKFKTIFDNFSQLGNESNTNYQGTGLGLSITKSIIELFESKVELESEVNKGTKFSFDVTFDIDKRENEVLDINSKSEKLNVTAHNQYNILIAEDNKINQIVTKNLLLKQNYNCDVVSNGAQAVEAMEATDYDLILMDINMPVMDGKDATKAIRQFNTNIPIIALTAADIEEIREDYNTIGFSDFITKPFDNYEFFQTIATHIQRAKQDDVTLVIAS